MAKIAEYTVAEARKIALGAAKAEARATGIDPLEMSARTALVLLDEKMTRETFRTGTPIEDCTIAVRWYMHAETDAKQAEYFGYDLRKWQREYRRTMGL